MPLLAACLAANLAPILPPNLAPILPNDPTPSPPVMYADIMAPTVKDIPLPRTSFHKKLPVSLKSF